MATIRRYTWNNGKPDATPGVLIRQDRNRVFIPAQQLTTFADFMVDTHEEQENA